MTIAQFAAAIAQAEGPQGLASKTNNPGNLTVGTGSFSGATGTNGSFLTFDSPASGQAALQTYLANGLAEVGTGSGAYGSLSQTSTLADFLNIYADNPPSDYVAGAATTLGVAPTTTLGQLQAILEPGGAAPPPPDLSTTDMISIEPDSAGGNPLLIVGVAIAALVVGAMLFREVAI